MPRAFGYIRFSTSYQGQNSIDIQKASINQVYDQLLKDTHSPIEWVEDLATSGSKIEFFKRPGGAKLNLMAAKDDAIVFAKLDRGFRNVRDMLNCLHLWDTRGIRIMCPEFVGGMQYDSKNMHSKFALMCLGYFAELFSSQIGQRTKEVDAVLVARGVATKKTPYGWTKSRRGLKRGRNGKTPYYQPHDEEQKIVHWIMDMKDRGVSIPRIVNHLNDNKVPGYNGGIWSKDLLLQVVKVHKKIRAYEERYRQANGPDSIRPWEFVTPTGVVMIRFDMLDQIPPEERHRIPDDDPNL